MRKPVTAEQFEAFIKRVFPKGYIVNEFEYEDKMYCEHAGFFHDDNESLEFHDDDVDVDSLEFHDDILLKVWLTDDEIMTITCMWNVHCLDLGEIQKRLDNIISETIPHMILFPNSKAPDVSNIKKGGLYHEFVYLVPLVHRTKRA